ncbi:hypothetical protein BDQ17DRAFT_1321124 [Cyathus striatus]|nr:hypothetical protein BDQ17DRAFT_1321124 [Cyathus striatus]
MTSTDSSHLLQFLQNSEDIALTNFDSTILNSNARVIRAVAYAQPQVEGYDAVNHWVFFLDIGHDKSVKLDMTPGWDCRTGILLVQGKSYSYTDNGAKTVEICTTPNTTISDLLEIITKRRERYRFTESGVGCRFWTVVQDWMEAGVTPFTADDMESFKITLEKYWCTFNKDCGIRELEVGEFL